MHLLCAAVTLKIRRSRGRRRRLRRCICGRCVSSRDFWGTRRIAQRRMNSARFSLTARPRSACRQVGQIHVSDIREHVRNLLRKAAGTKNLGRVRQRIFGPRNVEIHGWLHSSADRREYCFSPPLFYACPVMAGAQSISSMSKFRSLSERLALISRAEGSSHRFTFSSGSSCRSKSSPYSIGRKTVMR